jgi:hypothetical protein
VGIEFEMVARKFGHWALFDKAAEQRLALLFNGQSTDTRSIKTSVQDGLFCIWKQ